MKKIKKILALTLVALQTCSMAACGDDGDKTVLKVSVYAAGYGRSWLDEIADAFEAENPNVVVKRAATNGMDATADGALESGRQSALSDVYGITSIANYYKYIENGSIMTLNDVYTASSDGKTLEEKVDPAVIPMMKEKNDYYAVPWNASITSIAYNDKMFAEKGWSIPTTFDEFFALCDKITKETSFYALGYVGGDGCDGYFKRVVPSLAAQYGGVEAYKEFYKFENADVFEQEGRVKAYETIGKIITGKGKDSQGNEKPWAYPGTDTADTSTIVTKFAEGKVAMLFDGSWLVNEMKDVFDLYPNFSCKMMPLPWINSNKTSLDGGTINMNPSMCTMLVVPTNCAHPELAKKFLNFMNTNAMVKVFTEETKNVRPFKYENIDLGSMDGWTQSIVDIYSNSFNTYGISAHPEFRKGNLNDLMIGENNSIVGFFAGKDFANVSSIANAIVQDSKDYASAILNR